MGRADAHDGVEQLAQRGTAQGGAEWSWRTSSRPPHSHCNRDRSRKHAAARGAQPGDWSADNLVELEGGVHGALRGGALTGIDDN